MMLMKLLFHLIFSGAIVIQLFCPTHVRSKVAMIKRNFLTFSVSDLQKRDCPLRCWDDWTKRNDHMFVLNWEVDPCNTEPKKQIDHMPAALSTTSHSGKK
jgi:hypothetical protein